jgi:hypothetical protein
MLQINGSRFARKRLSELDLKDINFSCGNDTLDNYISEEASKEPDSRDPDGVAHIWINVDNGDLVAYATLCCSSIMLLVADNKFIPHPAVEIKCFSVDKKYPKIFV